jgi:hypothetical protein
VLCLESRNQASQLFVSVSVQTMYAGAGPRSARVIGKRYSERVANTVICHQIIWEWLRNFKVRWG